MHTRDVYQFTGDTVGYDQRVTRELPLANATEEVVHAAALGVSATVCGLRRSTTHHRSAASSGSIAAVGRCDRSAALGRAVGDFRPIFASRDAGCTELHVVQQGQAREAGYVHSNNSRMRNNTGPLQVVALRTDR